MSVSLVYLKSRTLAKVIYFPMVVPRFLLISRAFAVHFTSPERPLSTRNYIRKQIKILSERMKQLRGTF